MAKNNKEFEELKKKYFWKQKTDEILYILKWLVGSIILFFINYYITAYFWIGSNYYDLIGSATAELLIELAVYLLITAWIKENWEEAEDRARKDLGMKEREERYY